MPKFHVSKSIPIQAPLNLVYSKIRDFRSWPEWSPWLTAEPDCNVEFGDDGKSYSWNGQIVGSGYMEIVQEDPNRQIGYRLTFIKPWRSVSDVSFAFRDAAGVTTATWNMDGSLPFFMFWMKSMMTALIGMDFDRGLSMAKDLLERGSVPSKLEIISPQRFEGGPYIGIQTECDIPGIGENMLKDFEKIDRLFHEKNMKRTGNPFAVYHRFNLTGNQTEYTLAFPIGKEPDASPAGFKKGTFPSCETYCIKHTGVYRHLGNAWSTGMMHARAKQFRQDKKIHPFEVYETMPGQVAEEEAVTLVQFPVK